MTDTDSAHDFRPVCSNQKANDQRPTTNGSLPLYPWVNGIVCRLLFSTSSTSTETGVMCRIR